MKLQDVYYLTVEDVMVIHYEILLPGENPGVLQPGGLDAAIMAVQATYSGVSLLGSIAEIASAYVFYLNKSHVFMDGNKRTSLFSAFSFLEANQLPVNIKAIDWLAVVTGVVRGEVSQDDLTMIFARELGRAEEIE